MGAVERHRLRRQALVQNTQHDTGSILVTDSAGRMYSLQQPSQSMSCASAGLSFTSCRCCICREQDGRCSCQQAHKGHSALPQPKSISDTQAAGWIQRVAQQTLHWTYSPARIAGTHQPVVALPHFLRGGSTLPEEQFNEHHLGRPFLHLQVIYLINCILWM